MAAVPLVDSRIGAVPALKMRYDELVSLMAHRGFIITFEAITQV